MHCLRSASVAAIVAFSTTAALSQQTVLRYKAPAEPVQYSVKITVDAPSEKTTYEGRISYQGTLDGSGTLVLTYKGGLKKSSERKASASPSRPFGDPFGGGFGRPGFASPFARPTGPGALRQTEAKIRMTPSGEVLSMEGESQIPLPLGHLSLLVFEPLPKELQSSWTISSGVVLEKPRQASDGFPGDPFAKPAQPGKTSAGSETVRFTITGTRGSQVLIEKVQELDSPNTSPALRIAGKGPLVFDQDRGLFTSANIHIDAQARFENLEVKVPVTVEYHLMTAEEIAKVEREAATAASKAAEAAMEAERARFAGMSEAQIAELYRKGGEVPPTGRTITPEMKLPKGLLIQNKWPFHNKWSAAKFVRELPDGKIEFEAVDSKKLYQRDRSTLSLAPDFVEQPFVDSAELAAFRRALGGGTAAAPANGFRLWQDASGKFSVEAQFVALDGDNVVLRRKDDEREIKVPLSRLSAADQQFLSQQSDSLRQNPFH